MLINSLSLAKLKTIWLSDIKYVLTVYDFYGRSQVSNSHQNVFLAVILMSLKLRLYLAQKRKSTYMHQWFLLHVRPSHWNYFRLRSHTLLSANIGNKVWRMNGFTQIKPAAFPHIDGCERGFVSVKQQVDKKRYLR